MTVVLDARGIEVGQVAAVVDDALCVRVGEPDPVEGAELERGLTVGDAAELECHPRGC